MINKLAELSDTKKIALSVILIATVAIIIYSNSFYASFHFDDQPTIVENYTIHRFDLKEIFSTSSRPILDLTFALNYYFGKLNVFGYHLVNIMLHIANGVMLYFILLWTINTPHPNPPPQGGRAGEGVFSAVNFRVPLYASLIFIAHPIQTQAVTYIVSRSSVLATTFYLISVLFFIRAFKQIAKREEQKTNDERLYAPGSMPYALSFFPKIISGTGMSVMAGFSSVHWHGLIGQLPGLPRLKFDGVKGGRRFRRARPAAGWIPSRAALRSWACRSRCSGWPRTITIWPRSIRSRTAGSNWVR